MAPEQLKGEESDFRTDIYSVGAVLYEISTRRRPFEGNTSPVLADNILHKTPTPPRHFRAELSPGLQTLILRCLEKTPKLRYQSATELGTDLERLRMLAPLVRKSPFIHSSKIIDSLAVLPFENASSDSEMDYLSDGITETLINNLSQFPKLRVVPRNTVFRYKGREIDLREISIPIFSLVASLGNRLSGNRLPVDSVLLLGDDSQTCDFKRFLPVST